MSAVKHSVNSHTLLVVDDEAGVRESVRMIFANDYNVLSAGNGEEALRIVQSELPDVILLDVKMPGMNGMETLRKIKESSHPSRIVMITATKTIKNAVEAMKLGAEDYVTKPFDVDEIRLIVKRSLENIDLINEVKTLRSEVKRSYNFDNIIGRTESMQKVFKTIQQIADKKSTVAIYGESGTGKELIARAIHFNSWRREKPFVAVNIAAVPETLIENELFGHEKGAFTDARERTLGKFEMADGGTLFLDEIGELPMSAQVKLLRVLQEKEFTRLGSSVSEKLDVRFVVATNRDLEEAMRLKEFREDLYYRINVVPIRIPPLRERKNDIHLLVNHLLEKICAEACEPPFPRDGSNRRGGGDRRSSPAEAHPVKRISKEALELLMEYRWPGNVRELENVIERCVAFSNGDVILPEDLPEKIRALQMDATSLDHGFIEKGQSLSDTVEAFEKKMIQSALQRTSGNKTKAAESLRITRKMLRYKVEKYGIQP
ncbi:MAG: sigma-54-dependent Fis family transcriptional regulator [Deltaproteobacteria bacterium]|nr:sigma-54-dependent Fis family transcriptional regulator [Deltaproteobacteria bacterium]